MTPRTWLITGVSSGFGRELTEQLLERGVGTVRRPEAVADLAGLYPDGLRCELLDVTDTTAIRDVVERSFAELGQVDVVVSNAGYGLFGAAEELSDEQVEHIIATLVGSIQLIRAALPHLRAQGSGRIIQISSYGGQVAFPGNSLYHATNHPHPWASASPGGGARPSSSSAPAITSRTRSTAPLRPRTTDP